MEIRICSRHKRADIAQEINYEQDFMHLFILESFGFLHS